MICRRIIGALVAAAGAAVLCASWAQPNGVGNPAFVPAASAGEPARVIEIQAKKFAFTPDRIMLRKGEPVILRLSSEDRTHGFLLKPYKIDADIVPGKVTDIALTPESAGHYLVICDHYCGTGHGNMKLKLDVVE